MTTTVIISSPRPNHQKVGVQVEYLDAFGRVSGNAGPQIVLDDGESTIVYVHYAARVVVAEVPREAPAPAGDGVAGE